MNIIFHAIITKNIANFKNANQNENDIHQHNTKTTLITDVGTDVF